MFKLFIFFFCSPMIFFGQNPEPYAELLPSGVKARPFLDSIENFVPDSLEQTVSDYINSAGLDLQRCFINQKVIYEKRKGFIYIRLEDYNDLKNSKATELAIKSGQKPSDYKPGFSGTLCIDMKTRKVISFYPDE